MGTPFIRLQEPNWLDGYDPSLLPEQQSTQVPCAIKDMMEVRVKVFVDEKGCPLKTQYDADDPRSCHWIMYASVNMTTKPEERDPETDRVIRPRRSETITMAIGALRVVPFPHPPHPHNGARYVGGELQPGQDGPVVAHENNPTNGNGLPGGSFGNGAGAQRRRHRASSIFDPRPMSAGIQFGAGRKTDLHDGKEPYIKLGRVAVVSEFRKHNIADQIWNAAKNWLQENPAYFNPSVKELGFDVMRVSDAHDIPKWNGLVCVHAPESDIKFYERWGFQVDKGMGKFSEDEIPHVGMFQRLKLQGTDPRI